VNGKFSFQKEFYLLTKLKTLKTNLRFDETYKIIYKGKALSEDEEKQMTLDELCYKELKVFFIKVKDDNNNIKSSINNLYSNRNLKTKNYQNTSFDTHERFDTWIIIGKEKSGKTTFINCLCNYINEIKFEDNFRYLIKANNQKDC
jgi:polynucleotide 5'-kinase involved in rRNA processing